MKKSPLVLTAVVLAGLASGAFAEDKKATTTPAVKKAETTHPVVVEEFFFFPWRYEATNWLHNARVHYRASQEKAAASEVRKAEAWLKYAAGHAQPMTKKSLQTAADDLGHLATDLQNGTLQDSRRLDLAFAKANHALAEWHYCRAHDTLGHQEARDAAQNLDAAAQHLKNAAESANYEFGKDTVTLFDVIERDGRVVEETVTIDQNRLAKNLEAVEVELKKMGETLSKSVK